MVKVTDSGCRYTHYSDAFKCMGGDLLKKFATNVIDTPMRFALDYKHFSENERWIVIGKCLHEHGSDCDDIIYLIFNVRKRAMIMIGSDGIKKMPRSGFKVKESKFQFFQVGAK